MKFSPCLVALVLLFTACSSNAPQTAPQPAPQRHTITRVVAQISKEAKLDWVKAKDGQITGVTIAQQKNGNTLTCQCGPGCEENSGDPCAMQRNDQEGYTEVWCTGGCHTSENKQADGCGLRDSGNGGSGGGTGSGSGVTHGALISLTTREFELGPSGGTPNPSPVGPSSTPTGNK